MVRGIQSQTYSFLIGLNWKVHFPRKIISSENCKILKSFTGEQSALRTDLVFVAVVFVAFNAWLSPLKFTGQKVEHEFVAMGDFANSLRKCSII